MANIVDNRPAGMLDALNRPIPDSFADESFRGIYDASNNLIYSGYARPGTLDAAQKWQIKQLNYDASGNLISILWPTNAAGAVSADYEFIWNDGVTSYATYTYA